MFLVRTTLIHSLGEDYVGIEGVITNFMQLLNMSELGIGSAVLFRLYKPLAKGDNQSICTYVNFYKRACIILGIVILAIGAALSPFLPVFMVNIDVPLSQIYAIFWLYVCQTALSYWLFAFCSLVIQADQKAYVTTSFNTAGILIGSIGQMACYFIFHNYIAGLLCLIVSQIIATILMARYAKLNYPFLKNKKVAPALNKEQKKAVFKDIYALSLTKLCKTSDKSVPVLIVSYFLNAIQAGLYSNYQIIMNATESILNTAFYSITASVGNLNALGTDEQKNDVFQKLNFLMFFILSICVSCIWCLTTPFVELVWGSSYALSKWVVLAISFYITVAGFLMVIANFKEGSGIFWQGRYRPLIGFLLNVSFSIILVQIWGIAGVIWTAVLSRVLTESWFDPLLVYKHTLHRSPKFYFRNLVGYLLFICTTMCLAGALCDIIHLSSFIGLFVKLLIAIAVPLVLFVLLFRNNKNFIYYKEVLVDLTKGLLRRN